MAEVYWDMEWQLQQQGFDYTYDKRLYDRLREGHARPVREHLWADLDYQKSMARFLENHDEPRAAATFSADTHQAAAVITFLAPGLRFFHQGQLEGKRVKVSPHLILGPVEQVNEELKEFYRHLLNLLKNHGALHQGQWQQLQCQPAWESNWTSDCFLCYHWQDEDGESLIVAVNYAPNQSQCYVRLPFDNLAAGTWQFKDQIGQALYEREGTDLSSRGLFLDLAPWQTHVFSMSNSNTGDKKRSRPDLSVVS